MIASDHAAIAVANLEESRSFYVSLGANVLSRPSTKFLELTLGDLRLHLVKLTDPDLPPKDDHACPRIDHLCIRVDSMEELLAIKAQAESHPASRRWAPFPVIDSPPLGDRGEAVEQRQPAKTMYLRDPSGITIEVRWYGDPHFS